MSQSAANPMIRLMEAVRYARKQGGTDRDILELVQSCPSGSA